MILFPKFRDIKRLRLKSKEWDVELPVPAFNWKYLRFATAKGGRDHILFRLKTNSSPKENDIVQLKRGGDIIGFIIPGAALTSTSHDFADNAMFGPFALIALQKIVKNFSNAAPPDSPPQSLSELIDSMRYYCIINAEKCEVDSVEGFLDNFFPHLLSAGFVDGEIKEGSPTGAVVSYSGERTISINKPRKTSSFVRKALFEIMPYEANPFFSFFYAWQIVEHFMQLEFERRLGNFVATYNASLGVVNAKKSLDKINEIAKEKNRVRGVFSKGDAALDLEVSALYKEIDNELKARRENVSTLKPEELIASKEDDIDIALKSEANEEEEHYSFKLYYIRNVVFHSFGDVERYTHSMINLMVALSSYLTNKCLIDT